MKRAILYPYRYQTIGETVGWRAPLEWTAEALIGLGYSVDSVVADDIPGTSRPEGLGEYEVAVFTHALESEMRSRVNAPHCWSLKSTAPTMNSSTLDPVGYGPCSSVTTTPVPDCDLPTLAEASTFLAGAKSWLLGSKWGHVFPSYDPPNEPYDLVVGQTAGDETVTRMFFGGHIENLSTVVEEMLKASDRLVVVKLHPWLDGGAGYDVSGFPLPATSLDYSLEVGAALSKLSTRVVIQAGMASPHPMLANARSVVLCNSTMGLEALLHRKPVIAWGFPEYHWAGYDLRRAIDIGEALRLDWHDQAFSDRWICWYMNRYSFHDPAGALRRCRDLLGL